jgi:1,4-alpha-glucan branching enzyme/maltooligosyltrehalose trehalohydrolase
MPFGSEILPDARVRFRLWAPAAERVEVCLGSGAAEATLQMAAEPEGWFGLVTELATVGTRYRFRIDGGQEVPDPASRFQPEDVHGPSEVVDPQAWSWADGDWRGRPWQDAVIYELHVGSFSEQGNLAGVRDKLDYLVGLGVTAIELMPVADFPGQRNWGYDGVYLFAPDSRYGRPEDLKALVEAAHARGLMVFLDVVYNHFGPEGNYLHLYAPQFFTERHLTPWGAAINYDGPQSHWVRQFIMHNALYWLEEYHLDGLRLDAVHAILDDSQPDILEALADRVADTFGDTRQVHLVLENDHNAARYLGGGSGRPHGHYVAQWNDDIHHALHVLLTREDAGYYQDYAGDPLRHLGRCLTEGFAYQGEPSAYRDNRPRGTPSAHLPPSAFVSFLQNHDQVGNRALGERISDLAAPEALRAALALLLLAPSPPLLFMGQEWSSACPFLFFCDFGPDLADKVVEGRRQEFARFPAFRDRDARQRIPDPMAPQTFEKSRLDWSRQERGEHRHWLELHRELLALRKKELIPRLRRTTGRQKGFSRLSERALSAYWTLDDSDTLRLLANFGDTATGGIAPPAGRVLYTTHPEALADPQPLQLPPWSVIWYLQTGETAR